VNQPERRSLKPLLCPSDATTMEGLLTTFAFVIPAVVLMLVARRFLRVAEKLRDPEALSRRLKAEVEKALMQAGVDAGSVSPGDPAVDERVSREVARDVQQAILRTLFEAGDAPGSSVGAVQRHSVRVGEYTVEGRPRPIGQRSRSPLMLVALAFGLVAAVAVMLR
jgi:hypothetical protein